MEIAKSTDKQKWMIQKRKESLKNVDIKPTPATGLKAKLLERRKTKTNLASKVPDCPVSLNLLLFSDASVYILGL